MDDDQELGSKLVALDKKHDVLKQEMYAMRTNYLTELERTGRAFDSAFARNEEKFSDLKSAMEQRDTDAPREKPDS